MIVSSDLLSSLSQGSLAQPAAVTELEVPAEISPIIDLRQHYSLDINVVGRTFVNTFLNDAFLEFTNVAGGSTVLCVLTRGLWKLDWQHMSYRNFAGVADANFTLALTHDSGVSIVRLCRSMLIGAEIQQNFSGSLNILVTSPNLQLVEFHPTSAGVGNQVKSLTALYGQKLI